MHASSKSTFHYRFIAKGHTVTDMMRTDNNPKPVFQETFNPIFKYAARGQHHEKRQEWASSVHWYHRSLACLPNLFGSDKKRHPLELPYKLNIHFKPHHAGRIYASLGRALKAMGRRWDSVLAFQAAAALDPENIEAVHLAKKNPNPSESESANDEKVQGGPDPGKNGSKPDLKDNLTLIMATHCTRPLKKHAPLSPPSNKLVTATYGSMFSVFGDDIAACRKIICCDINPNGSERDVRYAQSIERFARQNEFLFRSFPGVGLFNVLNRIIRRVETPYLFFVEHDWMFRGGRITLPTLIETMEDEPRINAIRLNKRQNYLNGHDFLMSVDSASRPYPLMRTSSYSNNPSIIRTRTLKGEWLPFCEKSLRRVANRLGGSAFGVEEILFKKYVQDIRAQGFHKAHEKWGTYVFGNVGDGPRITHLGE